MKKKLPLLNPDGRSVKICRFLTVLFLSAMVSIAQSQPTILKDINESEDLQNNEFRSLSVGFNKVYFVNNFNELWKTTGNPQGTVRLKAFRQIGVLACVGETLFFSADDGNGMELWKSTGTYASTVKVKEFIDGEQGGGPQHITPGDAGIFYFVATTLEHGAELWRSNGTPGGTMLVKDIQPGRRGGAPQELTYINGTLYFTANDGKNGYELWKSDGTAKGTVMVKDIRTGPYLGSEPRQLCNVNGTLYFSAYEPVAGRELWRSSGTNETTSLVADIRPGTGSPDLKNLTSVESTLFFSANDGIHGHELWKCNGYEASLVKDLTPGPAGSHGQRVFWHPMGNFKNVAGQLFFTAYENSTYYIWKSDGTEAGTRPIEEAMNGISMPTPRFVAMGSSIFYFNATDRDTDYYGTELRRMNLDGSSSRVITGLTQSDYYSRYEPELVTLNNSLYFCGRRTGGFQLFRSNGTPGHVVMINDSHKATNNSSPAFALSHGGQLFFTAEEIEYERALWRTDGTSEGTIKVADENLFGSPAMAATGSTVYYSTYHSGLNIWKTNGTPSGTEQVVVQTLTYLNYVRGLTTVGEMLYIHVNDNGLWRCDGTEAGTYQLTPAQDILFMKPVGNQLYYMTVNAGDQLELWRTNGQPSQTFRVMAFTEGTYRNYVAPVADGNILYFMADDGVTGNEIWRSDGTATGTYRIADINTNDSGSPADELDISHMTVWENELYISASDEANVWALYNYDGSQLTRIRDVNRIALMVPVAGKLHLFVRVSDNDFSLHNHWVTDGTAEGTTLINDTNLYWNISYLIHDDILYYASRDAEFWRSDGTACGTFEIDLGAPSSGFMNLGNLLIFSATTPRYGQEPFVLDLSTLPPAPCESSRMTSFARSPNEDNGITLTSYPNPFSKEFTVSVAGSGKDVADLQIFNDSGFPVETIRNLAPNTEHTLGNSWRPGNYFIRISINGKTNTYQVLKE